MPTSVRYAFMLYDSFPYISPWFRETNKILNKQNEVEITTQRNKTHPFDRNGMNFRIPTTRPSHIRVSAGRYDTMIHEFIGLLCKFPSSSTTIRNDNSANCLFFRWETRRRQCSGHHADYSWTFAYIFHFIRAANCAVLSAVCVSICAICLSPDKNHIIY